MPAGSFRPEDVTLLLKDVTGQVEEREAAVRECEIQAGRHYSEDLPVEHEPSGAYMRVFHAVLESQIDKVALYTGALTQLVLREIQNPVLVSLVRAGVPCGVLMRRYARQELLKDIPHYGVSIIRGKGFDENALETVIKLHQGSTLVFVDGWTGKGMITKELQQSCEAFYKSRRLKVSPVLAVLADPAHSTDLYATREDFLNPSCCLNSTICGLISRTVHNDRIIGPSDFHGVRIYQEFAHLDKTAQYLDAVQSRFAPMRQRCTELAEKIAKEDRKPDWSGMDAVCRIGMQFGVADINRIKPSIGETTRVLLRRVPDRILVQSEHAPELEHILLLAQEKCVPVTVFPDMPYLCCGLIADKRGNAE